MILITGGTGFVGGHLIKRLIKKGLSVRVLVRNPAKARPLKELGVEVIPGDITSRSSLDAAVFGTERVIHLVGIIQEAASATFQKIHVEGTRNILDAAKKTGIRHFIYQSALGTRPAAKSEYHKTKWQAEELVRGSGIPYTILRPSLIYGPGDQFTIRLSEMIKMLPVLPVIGSGKAKIQPIYIDDVTACIEKAVTTESFMNEIYEIGGPDRLTYEELTLAIARAMGVKRPMLHLPLLFVKPMARIFETFLSRPPITTDQLIMLQEDNICSLKDIRDGFGIEPIGFSDGLARFMARA